MNIFENDSDYTMTLSYRGGKFTTKIPLYMLGEDGMHHKCASNMDISYSTVIDTGDLRVHHLHDAIANLVSPLKASSFKGIPLKELAIKLGASEEIIRPQWEYHQTTGHEFVLMNTSQQILPDDMKLISGELKTICVICTN